MKKIILLFIIFSSTMDITACSCADYQLNLKNAVKAQYFESSMIFAGKVIRKEDTNKEKFKSSMDIIVYTFEVAKFYKGELRTKLVEVKSYRDSASCGYEFEEGLIYLVYSNSLEGMDNQEFYTGYCKRNQILHYVPKKEISKLELLSKVQ